MAVPNKELDRNEHGWPKEEIDALELTVLKEIIACKEGWGVSAAMRFASYMSKKVGLNSDNYPIFFDLIETGNKFVIDTLTKDAAPETYFKAIQPNGFMIGECLRMLTYWQSGAVYAKSLQIIFGILKQTYESATDGYRLYKIDIPEVNNLGKHLDKEKDQRDPVNRIILYILDKIAGLVEPGQEISDQALLDVATQANHIRGKFLDLDKTLNEAIPDLLLIKGDLTRVDIAPLE